MSRKRLRVIYLSWSEFYKIVLIVSPRFCVHLRGQNNFSIKASNKLQVTRVNFLRNFNVCYLATRLFYKVLYTFFLFCIIFNITTKIRYFGLLKFTFPATQNPCSGLAYTEKLAYTYSYGCMDYESQEANNLRNERSEG